MSSIKWFICLFICIISFDINSFDIHFFEQSTKLFYVNAMNSDNGDIYFEFWGEDDSMRYYIGKNYQTEENMKFNGNEILSIDANSNWNYHESIIVDYNDDINIVSMNSKNIDYINIKNMSFSTKLTSQLIGSNNGSPSYRSSLTKLQDGNYLSSMVLKGSLSHKIYITIFKIESNYINSFQTIKKIDDKIIGYMNSTSCFQTESTYIQCSFSNVLPSNYFTVGIYDLDLDEKATVHFGYLLDYTFTKIFHIKGEIGAYIFFDDRDNNVPKLFIKKLNDNKDNLINLFSSVDNIILNNNGRYTLDYGLFASDAIKIDDLRFVVILTVADNSGDLLICLCDFNEDYTGIRIRYYYLDISTINIKITVNIRSFVFKDYFGLLFYDSNSEFPGYIFFNYPKIKGQNKIDCRTIRINLFEDSSSTTFSFSEHLELINNIYSGQIKIKIINYSSPSFSGVIVKSSSKDLSIGDVINFEEELIFERNITDYIPNEYFLEFSPFVEENESSTEKYGEYQESDFEEIGIFSKYVFNLTYLIQCQNDNFVYIKNEDVKYCLSSCIYDNIYLYQDETENICYNNCSDATNGNIYLYYNKCISHCPDNYFPDENNSCVLNEINSEISQSTNSDEILTQLNSLHSKEDSSQISNEISTESTININELNTFITISDIIIKNNDYTPNDCYIDIESLINDYKRKGNILEMKELEQCSLIYYCYSSNENMEALLTLNPNLIYIDFNGCRNSLINENLLDESSEILIIGKQKLISSKKPILNNFEYEIYEINGTKIKEITSCKNTKLEISSPISSNDYYENAISLYEQGFDIFNLSSEFYYDLCLSTYINNSDLTLSIRQNDIKPSDTEICLDGCIYNGVNLTNKRISCLCDLDYTNNNESSEFKQIENVEDNFFSYILGMINYKIIICHKLILNSKNYYYNFGFYSGIGILLVILLLFFIYYIKGKKSITIKYLRNAPKIKESSIVLEVADNTIQRNSHNIEIFRKHINNINNDKKSKTYIKRKTQTILLHNAPNKRRNILLNSLFSKNFSKDKTVDNIKRNTAKDINNNNINMNFEKNYENVIKANKNNNNNKMVIEKNEKEAKNADDIDYNNLTYSQAIIKDERSLIKMFLSYFNNRFEIIQIIFFPKEFSHKSVTLSLYLYELLLDLTFNSLLFSDEVISQKYYNNGNLLFITSQILSISSNIISCFLVYITSYLVNYYSAFEAAKIETKSPQKYYRIFIRISWFIFLKISIFYIIAFITGLFCLYYLFIFCSIFKKIQKNLFMNYFIGILWSLVYKVGASILSTILRKITIYGKFKKLYFISKFIDEKI